MNVQVDPAQLESYAKQLERNAEMFRGVFRTYCLTYCGHTEGMTGLLAAARPAVELARDATATLFAAGERSLYQLAINLAVAAERYRADDVEAAERACLALPKAIVPAGYVDRNDDRHIGDFRDPFVPVLNAPRRHDELARVVDEVRQHLVVIDEWLGRFAHMMLSGPLLTQLDGDWDMLRVNADAYAQLAGRTGVQVLRANLAYGMDSLSATWDSPAATAFAYTIRDRWLPAIDALQHFLELHKETHEWMAREAEKMLRAVVLALEFLRLVIVEKALHALRLTGVPGGSALVWREIDEVVDTARTVGHEVVALFELVRATLQAGKEVVELAAAEIRVLEDMWLAPNGSRFDPLLNR